MSVFSEHPENHTPAYIASAHRVSKEIAFTGEIDSAVKDLYAGVIDAIKQKNWGRAELMNDVAEVLHELRQRFSSMSELYETNKDNQSEDEQSEDS